MHRDDSEATNITIQQPEVQEIALEGVEGQVLYESSDGQVLAVDHGMTFEGSEVNLEAIEASQEGVTTLDDQGNIIQTESEVTPIQIGADGTVFQQDLVVNGQVRVVISIHFYALL